MSVDRHNTTSNFSSVLDGGSVDVLVSSPEKLSDPGRGEIMFVDRLVFEQHYVLHLGDYGLVLPDHVESASGKFLDP